MRFVLVHGGFHGGWCFTLLAAELRAEGHEVVSPDLPGHGERQDEPATLDAYRSSVVEVMEDGDVVVGHSMGGYVASVAADAADVVPGHLVYLAAGVPVEGQSMAAVHTGDPSGIGRYYRVEQGPHGEQMVFTSRDAAVHHFFHDCDEQTAGWAFEHLTPQPMDPITTPIRMSRFWDLPVPKSFIACLDDRSGFNYYLEEHLGRLGLDTVFPIMSSHSPFLSRPADFARLLVHVATTGPRPS